MSPRAEGDHLNTSFYVENVGIIHALVFVTKRDARMVTLKMLTGSKTTTFIRIINMSALALQNTVSSISEEAKTHIIILTELLRDVDLEGRMMTLIKAQDFLTEEVPNEIQLQSIRSDLEYELVKMRKMIFMVEKAQYVLETV